jgi:aminopeptidase N
MDDMHTVPRLHEIFQPTHYDLELTLEREKRTFHGSVTIDGSVVRDTSTIQLHATDLEVTFARIDGIPVEHTIHDDMLTLISSHENETGLRVEIGFSGTITDPMHGLYPCYYEEDGVKKELLATQFESHHAREVFPCIDEPSAKATFDVTLTTEQGVAVLGNMPIKQQSKESDTLVTSFDTTPHMSPYLLAFVIGDLQKKTAQTSNGTEVNVWATKAQPAESLDYALDVSVRTIEFFNDYFDTPYPLPKCDHVALPDFSSGAMENWGLITYREVCLLAEPSTAVSSKQFIAIIIAHETSHQWFGNLVTMSWWDDLWLNESFASLMEYVCVDALFPEWDVWMMFANRESLAALRRDYLPGIQAVKTEVHHPDEISTLFDPSIVYAKGARLLDMLRAYVGDDTFRLALHSYFKQHAYQNTTGNDLWNAISTKTGTDISAFMRPWLEQSGMPIVHVTKTSKGLTLKQEKFVIPADGDSKTYWPIPVETKTGRELLADATGEFHAHLPLNLGNHVHAVYAYDKTSYAEILSLLASGKLSPIDRLSLLHESSLIARGGYIPTADLLPLIKAYRTETEEPVWDIIGLVYGDLKRFTELDVTAEKALKALVVSHASELYKQLDLHPQADESESTTKLRAIIAGLLTYADHQPLIDDALELFHSAKDLTDLSGELRPLICLIAVRHGSEQDIERIIATHNSTNSAELKQDMCEALTGTKDPVLIKQLLGYITDDTIVRAQDVDRWFIYLIRNRYGRELAWDWLISHWSWIEKKFKSDKSYDAFPRYAASALSTKAWLERYEDFFGPLRNQASLKRVIDLGIKDIESRADWLERDGAAVVAALKK